VEAAAKPSAAAVTAAGGGVTIKFDNVDGLGSFVQVWTCVGRAVILHYFI
jgi:hypothetical protein